MTSAFEALPREHQRVVDLYIKTLDKSLSYQSIYSHVTKKSAYTMSSQFFKKVEIVKAVAERVAERNSRVEVNSDMVLREVKNAAMLDPIDLFDDKGNLKDLSMIPSCIRRCITAIEVEALYEGKGEDRKLTGYTKRVKLVSKEKMIELLGKHVGLFPNRHEVGGVGGGPIKVDTTVTEVLQLLGVDDLKLLRSIKEALDRKARDQQLASDAPKLLAHAGGNGDNGGGNGSS